MKRLTTLLLLFVCFGVNAQWQGSRQLPLGITQGYVTNSPGNSPANSKTIWQTQDSTSYRWDFPVIQYSKFNSSRNDGTPVSVAWFDTDGVLKRSPFPTIPSGQVQSDWNAVSGMGVILNKPDLSVYVPSSRTINSKPLTANITLVKGDIGLGNVDNTSDANKPVSTAQAAALAEYSMFNYLSKTANYTVSISDWGVKPLLIIEVDATGGNVTITLPVPSSYVGRVINVKRMDSSMNTVTVSGNGFNIDNVSSLTIMMQYGNAQIYSKSTQHLML